LVKTLDDKAPEVRKAAASAIEQIKSEGGVK
jgi:HEAT repeat protein